MPKTNIPRDHIVFTELDGGQGMLVDLDTKSYYQLNETAMLVWRCLERRCSTTEIVNELTNGYDVTPDHAAGSVEKVLQHFYSHQLLRPLD